MSAEESVVTYDRISEDPKFFHEVISRQLMLADELHSGAIQPEVGKVEGAALLGATRTLDADVRARALAHQMRRFEHRLAGPRERSNADPSGRSSQAQLSDAPQT